MNIGQNAAEDDPTYAPPERLVGGEGFEPPTLSV